MKINFEMDTQEIISVVNLITAYMNSEIDEHRESYENDKKEKRDELKAEVIKTILKDGFMNT